MRGKQIANHIGSPQARALRAENLEVSSRASPPHARRAGQNADPVKRFHRVSWRRIGPRLSGRRLRRRDCDGEQAPLAVDNLKGQVEVDLKWPRREEAHKV